MDTTTLPRKPPTATTGASPRALEAIERSRLAVRAMEPVRARFEAELARLKEERAEAVRCALDEGMTQAGVARALGVTVQAVNNLLRTR